MVLPGKGGLRFQKLMLKANLVVDHSDQCVRLLQRLLHGKHCQVRAAMHAHAGLRVAVRPVLGTVPSIGAIPGKVAKHTTLETFDRLAPQRIEATTERYGDPWVVGC